MALAVEQRLDTVPFQAVVHAERSQLQPAPILPAHGPGQPSAGAQDGVDPQGDGSPVLGAGEAVRPAPSPQHLVRRA